MALNIDIVNPWGGFYAGMENLNKSILGQVEMMKTKSALEHYELESEISREKLEMAREERSMNQQLGDIAGRTPMTKEITKDVLVPGTDEEIGYDEAGLAYIEKMGTPDRMETTTETVPTSYLDKSRYAAEYMAPIMLKSGNINSALAIYDDVGRAEQQELSATLTKAQVTGAYMDIVKNIKETYGEDDAEEYMKQMIAAEPQLQWMKDFKFDSKGDAIVTDIEGTNYKIIEYKGKVQFVEIKPEEEPASVKEAKAFMTDPVFREGFTAMETLKKRIEAAFRDKDKDDLSKADEVKLQLLKEKFVDVTKKMTTRITGGKVAGKEGDVVEYEHNALKRFFGAPENKKYTEDFQEYIDEAKSIKSELERLGVTGLRIPGEALLTPKAGVTEAEKVKKFGGVKPAYRPGQKQKFIWKNGELIEAK